MTVAITSEYWRQEEEAAAYIGRIRRPSKRAYAQAYWLHLRYGGAEPARPTDLSFMAAQAVRIALGRYARG